MTLTDTPNKRTLISRAADWLLVMEGIHMKTTEQYFQEFYNEVRFQIEQGIKQNFTRANKIWAEYEAAQQSKQAEKCPVCAGKGVFAVSYQVERSCEACNGTGKKRLPCGHIGGMLDPYDNSCMACKAKETMKW